MISSTHITTGAALGLAVGSIIPNPYIAIPVALVVGVVSHHILDMIPHTDPGSFRKDPNDSSAAKPEELWFALPDNVISTAVIVAIFLLKEPSWPMLFGAVGGNLPDVWHNVGFWSDYTRHRVLPKYFELHEKNHFTARDGLIPLGIATNLVLIVLSLWYILSR